jgi:pimeloyl-ACP methyl ester carboxylesterase
MAKAKDAKIKNLVPCRTNLFEQGPFTMIWKSDAGFIKRGMKAVLHWENDTVPQPFWHIHGTKDEVFPVGRVGATHIIKGGGHMLTMSHFEEVNRILARLTNTARHTG